MKVLFMANIPSPYRVDFFNELGKNCDLTVTFEGKTATDRDVKWKAAEYRNFKAVFMNGIRTKSDQFLCVDILKIIKSGFDHIILGGYSTPTAMLAIEYMRLKHIQFWMEADGGMIAKDSYFKYQIKRHFISAASGWFSSGKMTTEYLVHYGADKARVHLYPFTSLKAADILPSVPKLENKEELKKNLHLSEGLIAIAVGQFIRRKGFDVLLKSWAKCNKKYELYIIGAEPTAEYIELKKNLMLDNVHFEGFKTKEELKQYYQAADLFVLPTREDIWGLVVNEAMANGLPVLTTDKCVAGLELIEDGINGYIVPVEDERMLAERITAMLENNSLRNTMTEKSLKKIRDYTVENMVRAHLDVLKIEE